MGTTCRVKTVSSEQETALVVVDNQSDFEAQVKESFEVPLKALSIPNGHVSVKIYYHSVLLEDRFVIHHESREIH